MAKKKGPRRKYSNNHALMWTYDNDSWTSDNIHDFVMRYGLRPAWAFHPPQAAEYEDMMTQKFGEDVYPPHERVTCPTCRAFAPREHIIEHINNPDTETIQKTRSRARSESHAKEVADGTTNGSAAQFSQPTLFDENPGTTV